LFEVNGKNCDYGALLITLAGCSDSDSASDEDWDGFSPRKTVVAGDRGSALGQGSQMTGSQNVAVGAEDSDASRGHSILSLYRSVRALLRIDVYRYLLAGMSVFSHSDMFLPRYSAMAALYFTVTGVQFWGTSYMMVALGTSPTLVHALFVLVAATGPTAGVFFGGWCIDVLGGYKGATQRVTALELCSIFGNHQCSGYIPMFYHIRRSYCSLWVRRTADVHQEHIRSCGTTVDCFVLRGSRHASLFRNYRFNCPTQLQTHFFFDSYDSVQLIRIFHVSCAVRDADAGYNILLYYVFCSAMTTPCPGVRALQGYV
jgi:hypothetical protein